MAFTFVHTADWQIGKAFGRYPPEVGGRLRAERLNAIDRVAAVARAADAHHVMVAGDIIDSELIDDAGLRQPLARMSTYPDLTWHLLPGNHDPHRSGGIWERVVRLGVPSNVVLLLRSAVQQIAPGVALLPAPLAAKEMRSDPTLWMDGASIADGTVRIGIAHGSVRGFGSLGEAAVPIDATRRLSASLDYLALGDWHGVKEVAPGVWYSGTPEPDSFMDNGPGHALVVRIAAAGAPPVVSAVATAAFRWRERRLVLSRLADFEPLADEIDALGEEGRRLILSLRLEGTIAAADAVELDERIARLAALPVATSVDRSRLMLRAGATDIARITDPMLANVARRLVERSQAGDPASQRVAPRALQVLLAMSAGEVQRE
jgi:DNA repair exonuclease SbcCD nuclease subunit